MTEYKRPENLEQRLSDVSGRTYAQFLDVLCNGYCYDPTNSETREENPSTKYEILHSIIQYAVNLRNDTQTDVSIDFDIEKCLNEITLEPSKRIFYGIRCLRKLIRTKRGNIKEQLEYLPAELLNKLTSREFVYALAGIWKKKENDAKKETIIKELEKNIQSQRPICYIILDLIDTGINTLKKVHRVSHEKELRLSQADKYQKIFQEIKDRYKKQATSQMEYMQNLMLDPQQVRENLDSINKLQNQASFSLCLAKVDYNSRLNKKYQKLTAKKENLRKTPTLF